MAGRGGLASAPASSLCELQIGSWFTLPVRNLLKLNWKRKAGKRKARRLVVIKPREGRRDLLPFARAALPIHYLIYDL